MRKKINWYLLIWPNLLKESLQKNFIIRAVKTLPAITCSKLTTETLEQGVKYV